jgi:acetyl-CoA carboxylase biotin carboxyl carrier protein
MNQKELKELIEFLIDKDISEFELERGDVKVKIKRGAGAQPIPIVHQIPIAAAIPAIHPISGAAPAAQPPGSAAGKQAEAEEDLHIVKSPIVGTFYEAPSPGSPPFVKVGDVVEVGQLMCIIEAMKLMNEIESDVAGEVVKRLVANSQPVEYGQPLFAVRPRK